MSPSKPAPDFHDISGWINSEPQGIQHLRGKVVLLDFWTYGCANYDYDEIGSKTVRPLAESRKLAAAKGQ